MIHDTSRDLIPHMVWRDLIVKNVGLARAKLSMSLVRNFSLTVTRGRFGDLLRCAWLAQRFRQQTANRQQQRQKSTRQHRKLLIRVRSYHSASIVSTEPTTKRQQQAINSSGAGVLIEKMSLTDSEKKKQEFIASHALSLFAEAAEVRESEDRAAGDAAEQQSDKCTVVSDPSFDENTSSEEEGEEIATAAISEEESHKREWDAQPSAETSSYPQPPENTSTASLQHPLPSQPHPHHPVYFYHPPPYMYPPPPPPPPVYLIHPKAVSGGYETSVNDEDPRSARYGHPPHQYGQPQHPPHLPHPLYGAPSYPYAPAPPGAHYYPLPPPQHLPKPVVWMQPTQQKNTPKKARKLPTKHTSKAPPDSPQSKNPIKGPWTDDEDKILQKTVEVVGARHWSKIAVHLPGRAGKQCRERWHNHLNPQILKTAWTLREDHIILTAQADRDTMNRWSAMAKQLPGRYVSSS
jgi:Myb-like DNA-binding domain